MSFKLGTNCATAAASGDFFFFAKTHHKSVRHLVEGITHSEASRMNKLFYNVYSRCVQIERHAIAMPGARELQITAGVHRRHLRVGSQTIVGAGEVNGESRTQYVRELVQRVQAEVVQKHKLTRLGDELTRLLGFFSINV